MDCNRLLAILSTKRIVFLDKSQIFLCFQIFFRCSLAAGDHLCRPAAGTIIGIITGLGTNYFLHTSSITVWRVPSTAQPAPACTHRGNVQVYHSSSVPASQPRPGCTVRELLSGSSPLTYILHTRHTAPCALYTPLTVSRFVYTRVVRHVYRDTCIDCISPRRPEPSSLAVSTL